MINYTIIIPHKNIPALLQRCLDSIPRRKDVQIIIVDDNSDKSIVDFDNFPGLNDPFVEIIFGKNENGRKGAGYARNLGLEKAKGKWLLFADADDYFMPCLNDVLDKYKNDENDIIFFYVTSIDNHTLELSTRHIGTNDILNNIQNTNNWKLCYKIHNPWGKFIKKHNIINNNIMFREVLFSNDLFLIINVIAISITKIISDEVIYCIVSRQGSLINQISVQSLIMRFNELYNTIIELDKKDIKHYYLKNSLFRKWETVRKISIIHFLVLTPKIIKHFDAIFIIKYYINILYKWLSILIKNVFT